MKKLFQKGSLYCDPNTIFCTGYILSSQSINRFVTLSRKKIDNSPILIGYGTTVYASGCYAYPPIVHTTITSPKVFVYAETIGNSDPQLWLEKNGSQNIILSTSDSSLTYEWEVRDGTICYAILQKKSIESALLQDFLYASMSIPLWDLALCYAQYVQTDFILWKITTTSSVIGFVHKKVLWNLCEFWPNAGELRKPNPHLLSSLSMIFKSITKGYECTTVIVYSDIEGFFLAPDISVPGFEVKKPLVIDKVPLHYHEAYACALHSTSELDFSPSTDVFAVTQLQKKRYKYLKIFKISIFSLLTLFSLLLITYKIQLSIYHKSQSKLKPFEHSVTILTNHKKTVDSLQALFNQRANVITQQSRICGILNALQTTLSEGVWLDQIEIIESEQNQWDVGLLLCTFSASNIAQCINALQKTSALDSVRMVYSEQQKSELNQMITRVKIKCNWTY